MFSAKSVNWTPTKAKLVAIDLSNIEGLGLKINFTTSFQIYSIAQWKAFIGMSQIRS